MSRPTHKEAVDYVTRMESGWHRNPVIAHSVKDVCDNGVDCVDVQTQMFAWTVWLDETGRIYGEC